MRCAVALLLFLQVAHSYIVIDRLSPEEYDKKVKDYKFKINAHANRELRVPGVDGCKKCKEIVGTLFKNAETKPDGPKVIQQTTAKREAEPLLASPRTPKKTCAS